MIFSIDFFLYLILVSFIFFIIILKLSHKKVLYLILYILLRTKILNMPANKKKSSTNESANLPKENNLNLNDNQSENHQKSSTDIVSKYLKDAQDKIILDLQDHKLIIPTQQKQLLNEHQKEILLKQKEDFEIQQIKKEKQSAKLHLQQLDEQYKNIRREKYYRQKTDLKNSRIGLLNQSSISRSRLGSSKTSKSFGSNVLSNKQAQQINKKMKKLKKQRDQFAKRCANRAQLREKQMQELQKQVKSLKEDMIQALKQNSKKKAEQGLNQLQKRKQERAKQHEMSKQRVQQLKSRWNLHDGMEKFWQLKEKKQKQLKIQKSRAKYNKLNWNAQQIREHSKKYDQILQKQRESRKNKMLELSRVAENAPISYHSIYYDQVITQQKNRKQKANPKIFGEQLRQKIRAFDQYVRNQKKPTVKPQEAFQPVIQETKAKKGLQYLQAVHLGNEYLKEGNKRIKPKTETDDPQFNENKQNVEPVKKINYLPDLKAKRKQLLDRDPTFQEKSKEKYWREIERAKQIVNSNLSHEEKLQQIRQLTHQIQSGQILPNNKLIDKVTAKLKILQMIQQ